MSGITKVLHWFLQCENEGFVPTVLIKPDQRIVLP